jgi:CubicO group peptidase (beta-lactamase class C family)
MADPSQIVSSFLLSEIERASFPGAQYAIGEDQIIVAEDALGLAVLEPEQVSTTLETIYDLASLTKPLVTALLIMKFSDKGLLNLDAPLAEYLIEFSSIDKRWVTLRALLTHTSSLPNWRPLYLEAQTREQIPGVIARVLADCKDAGSAEVIYSDLNYILLGFILERISGEQLDRLSAREIFEPLGLKSTAFNPPRDWLHRIAATEEGQQFEATNAGAMSLTSFPAPSQRSDPGQRTSHRWRKGVIRGEVHDGNANFMGGVAGHAGLFSTAREVFRIANQFLPGSRLLKADSLHLFTDNLTPGCTTSRSLAWVLAETPDCSAGAALPPGAFGHNGFTGSSVWVDPGKMRVLVLLTNRVHPRVGPIDMRDIRRRFNTLAVEQLES